MKHLVLAIVLLIAIVVAAETVLPAAATRALAAHALEITRSVLGTPLEPILSTEVRSSPALKMLLGRIDQFTIAAGPVVVAGYPVDHVAIDAFDLRIDPTSLSDGRTVRVLGIGEMTVKMALTEDTLNRNLARLGLPVASPRLTLDDGVVRVSGLIRIAGFSYDIGVAGRLAVSSEEPTRVYFYTDQLEVNGQRASPVLSAAIRQVVGNRILVVDLQRQGIQLTLKGIEVSRKQIILLGSPRS